MFAVVEQASLHSKCCAEFDVMPCDMVRIILLVGGRGQGQDCGVLIVWLCDCICLLCYTNGGIIALL